MCVRVMCCCVCVCLFMWVCVCAFMLEWFCVCELCSLGCECENVCGCAVADLQGGPWGQWTPLVQSSYFSKPYVRSLFAKIVFKNGLL